MHAAVVRSFGSPPRYSEVPAPEPDAPREVLVQVLAAGLHPRVRSQANGSHYSSTGELPLIPGVDGVGRLTDGRLVYFVLPDTTSGSMADHTAVDLRRIVVLPEDLDPVILAAAMNPAMSSWAGLRRRLNLQAGQRVLVIGATGSAGQLAIQIAKLLGAAEVIGAGRDRMLLDTLPALGADGTVSLLGEPDQVAERLASGAADVDVVLDYAWGTPAADAMTALITARADRGRKLTWLQIGSVAGPTAPLPSAAFRSANYHLLGSGQGSVSSADILAELPELAARIAGGELAVNPVAVPLADVERTWTIRTVPGQRIVLVP